MQIEARFRRRAEIGQSLSELNADLLDRLSKVEGFWSINRIPKDAPFDVGNGESAATDLSPCLVNGIHGAISYASRLPAAIVDKARSDDSFVIQFDTEIVDFQWFSLEIFPEIVTIFNSYRAVIVTDLDQDLDDFENIVREARLSGRDVDGRDTVFRLHPVNYFDNTMCLRAFGIRSEDVMSRLVGSNVMAKTVRDGAFLVLSTEPLLGKPLIDLDASVREKLIRR